MAHSEECTIRSCLFFFGFRGLRIMTVESGTTKQPDFYAASTRQRMGRAIAELQRFVRMGALNLDGTLRGLRDQEAASRQAGFEGISRLAQDAADRLASARGSGRLPAAAEVPGLLDACQYIEVHADAIAKRVIHATGAEACGRKSGASAEADRSNADLNDPARSPSVKTRTDGGHLPLAPHIRWQQVMAGKE